MSDEGPNANSNRKTNGFSAFNNVIPVTSNYSVGGNSRIKMNNPVNNTSNQSGINVNNFKNGAGTTMSSGFQK